ncbi:MAG: 23S rRNA (pseudouridine(1915)-N(3))-methyltransferase RlmH [Myxococcota bacterium]
MRVVIAAVGKVKEKHVRKAVDDYTKRIGRYARFEEHELRDGSDDEVAKRFDKVLGDRSFVVALEVDGKPLSSQGLAKQVARCEGSGVQSMVFLIGGSYGLPSRISDAADLKLSLSAMTLPHRLARLVLAEQVYRAFTILRGEPYSH